MLEINHLEKGGYLGWDGAISLHSDSVNNTLLWQSNLLPVWLVISPRALQVMQLQELPSLPQHQEHPQDWDGCSGEQREQLSSLAG